MNDRRLVTALAIAMVLAVGCGKRSGGGGGGGGGDLASRRSAQYDVFVTACDCHWSSLSFTSAAQCRDQMVWTTEDEDCVRELLGVAGPELEMAIECDIDASSDYHPCVLALDCGDSAGVATCRERFLGGCPETSWDDAYSMCLE